jgi:hypothetical protein
MNRTMYRFGIITCIFPVSFITGLLGINVGGIPGSSSPLLSVRQLDRAGPGGGAGCCSASCGGS